MGVFRVEGDAAACYSTNWRAAILNTLRYEPKASGFERNMVVRSLCPRCTHKLKMHKVPAMPAAKAAQKWSEV